MFKVLLLMITLLTLTGCSTCKPMYPTSGDKIKLEGLEFPIKSLTPVRIGKFDWEPVEIQKVSEAVLSLDAYSVSQCRIMKQVADANPSSPAIATIAEKIVAANEKMLAITTLIVTGAQPKTVTEAAQQTKIPTSSLAPSEFQSPHTLESIGSQLQKMETDLTNLKGALIARQPGLSDISTSYSVGEFEPGKIVLTSKMKSDLIQLAKKLAISSSSATPILFDCIGFADASGEYLENVQLALARARSVSAYIETLNFNRPSRMRSVSSGGIDSITQMSRRVDIQITGLNM